MVKQPTKKPKSKTVKRKRRSKKGQLSAETKRGLNQTNAMFANPGKGTPRKWSSLLKKHIIPKSKLAIVMGGVLLYILKSKTARSAVFTGFGHMFPDARQSLGTTQIVSNLVDGAHAQVQAPPSAIGKIAEAGKHWVEHKAGLAAGNPRNLLIDQMGTRMANTVTNPFGTIAGTVARYLTKNPEDGVLVLTKGVAETIPKDDAKLQKLILLNGLGDDFLSMVIADERLMVIGDAAHFMTDHDRERASKLWVTKHAEAKLHYTDAVRNGNELVKDRADYIMKLSSSRLGKLFPKMSFT